MHTRLAVKVGNKAVAIKGSAEIVLCTEELELRRDEDLIWTLSCNLQDWALARHARSEMFGFHLGQLEIVSGCTDAFGASFETESRSMS